MVAFIAAATDPTLATIRTRSRDCGNAVGSEGDPVAHHPGQQVAAGRCGLGGPPRHPAACRGLAGAAGSARQDSGAQDAEGVRTVGFIGISSQKGAVARML
jgi:hypothetical protein